MNRNYAPGKGPRPLPCVATARDAAQAVYEHFGEPCLSSTEMPWGDFGIVSQDARGRQNIRIVPRERNPQNSIDYRNFADRRQATARDAQPVQEGGKMTFDSFGERPLQLHPQFMPAPPRRNIGDEEPSEHLALAKLDELEGVLLGLDRSFMQELVPFNRAVTAKLRARTKARKDEARQEFEKFTTEGRRKLAELRKLEAERDGLRADLNKAIINRNGASARYQAVKRQKPQDSEFPDTASFDAWENRMKQARAELDKAESEADALRAEARSYIPGIAELKHELASLRARRENARRRAELRAQGEGQDSEEEAETLQVVRG